MITLGQIALVVAFIIALCSAVASIAGTRLRSPNPATGARYGVLATAFLFTLSMAIMMHAFITKDFSLKIVYLHANEDLSSLYSLTALYADKGGSLFFWGWLLSVFGAILVIHKHKSHPKIMPYTIAIIAISTAFFLALATFVQNVFEQNSVTPMDGLGLNPLLINFGMLIHPPLLYIGYAAFMVVFAFAIGALISRSSSSEWTTEIRRWALFAWCTLGLGNLLGAWWAYDELNWGGYWAWDPVENAGLMPWLLGTAFIHSIVMLRKRNYLERWSFALIILTFGFILLSPFITHGGINSELHGFKESPFLPYLSGALIISFVAPLTLLIFRERGFEDKGSPKSLISREGAFLLTNIILVIIVVLIISLTVYFQEIKHAEITLERFKLDVTAGPMLLVLVFLMGICPVLGWKKTSLNSVRRHLLPALLAAAVVAIIILITNIGNWYAVAALVCGVPLFTIFYEWLRGIRARHRSRGENYLEAFVLLIWNNKPRYGGFVVHIGIILITIGVIGSSMYDVEEVGGMERGESMQIQKYEVVFADIELDETPTELHGVATINVLHDNKQVDTLYPEFVYHKSHGDYLPESTRRQTFTEDLYISLSGYYPEDDVVVIKAIINPLIVWMWIGGIFLLLGGMIAFMPDFKRASGRDSKASPLQHQDAQNRKMADLQADFEIGNTSEEVYQELRSEYQSKIDQLRGIPRSGTREPDIADGYIEDDIESQIRARRREPSNIRRQQESGASVCPACGTKGKITDKFCASCGRELSHPNRSE